MCSFIVTNRTLSEEIKLSANRFAQSRGPDLTNIFIDPDTKITWLHNLLHITGDKTPQPFIQDDFIATFNGQIYNYKNFKPDAPSDGYCIIDVFKDASWHDLDGEFAIVFQDKIKDTITVVSDTFATKPCWISISENDFAISSYKTSNISLGFSEDQTFKTSPNTSYCIDLKSMTISRDKIYKFNLDQNINSFDTWCELFDLSVKKRIDNTCEKFFVGLSSGYDSGCIVSSLQKHNAKFTTYSVRADESLPLLEKRHGMLDESRRHLLFMKGEEFDSHKEYISKTSEPYESTYIMNNKRYIVQNDKGSVGTSFICSHAKNDNYKIYMSGHGSDEVYSDYGFLGYPIPGFEHCDIAGYYPEDLSTCFPWKNFNGYRMIDFAYKDESIGGSYGIEVRYPFLDRDLVQEFLNIRSDLKNKHYKSPLHHYLKKNDYPFLEGPAYKVGFRATANLL